MPTIKIGDIVGVKEKWAKGIAFEVVSFDFQDIIHSHYVEETDEYWEDIETVEIPDRFICVMVGDDRRYSFDVEDLYHLEEEEYCVGCGQIGCRLP